MVKKKLLRGGCAAVLLVVAACSSDEDANDGIAKNVAVCPVVHHPLSTPNTAAYRIYASDAAAVADLQVLLPKLGRKPPIAPGSAAQAKAEALLETVYRAFRELYPDETVGLEAPPRAVVINDTLANAFAFRDPLVKPSVYPWVVVFHSGAFDAGASEEALHGLVAHELAHLVLRNNYPGMVEGYGRHYRVTGDEKAVFGALVAESDPAIKARATELKAQRDRVGLVGVSALAGVPTSAMGAAEYVDLFVFALGKYKGQGGNLAACNAYAADVKAIDALIEPHRETNDYWLDVAALSKAELSALTEKAKDDLRGCMKLPKSIAAIAQEKYGRTPPFDADEQAAETKWAGKDFVGEMIELFALRQTQLETLELDPKLPADSLRFYQEEEDADLVSARVMRKLKLDPRATGIFLLQSKGEPYASSCLGKVQKHEVPYYGAIRNDHPGSCWRYWNLDRFAKTLDVSCTD